MKKQLIAAKHVKSKILKGASRVGDYSVLMYKYLSDHPKDEYLFLVLAKDRATDTYTTWIFNDSCGGLAEGHYRLKSLAVAVDDIRAREHVTNMSDANPAFPIQFWDDNEVECLG